MNDNLIEENRYYSRAAKRFNANYIQLEQASPSYMRPSVFSYHSFLKTSPPGSKLLEIGAVMDENTECLLDRGLDVHSTDISEKSVEHLKLKFNEDNFFAEVADVEELPFNDNTFDIVVSAGGLSYGDNIKIMREIYRVLVRGGTFIALDSLNDNPIYKFNRYIHYLRGNRSKSNLKRMPTVALINHYAEKFSKLEISYYGSLTWLFPSLKLFVDDERIVWFSEKFDQYFNIKKSAFKFVMKVTKP